jgi:hypothetical protein
MMATKKVSPRTFGVPTSKLGPQKQVAVPCNAVWLTSNQTRARYGDRSQMWLWRMVKYEPRFPKPVYFGRLQFFEISALEAYEQAVISDERVA